MCMLQFCQNADITNFDSSPCVGEVIHCFRTLSNMLQQVLVAEFERRLDGRTYSTKWILVVPADAETQEEDDVREQLPCTSSDIVLH